MIGRQALIALVVAAAPASAQGDGEAVDFNRDIRPILSNKCVFCHGPDEAERQAGLRLDRAEDALADRGGYAAIVPGDPDASELIYRVEADDELDVMPPKEVGKPVTPEEADAYYASRSRGSRIGAWASKQSRKLEGRWALEKAVAEYTLKFGIGEVPRPEFWSGFRVLPRRIEFWRNMPFRLHERVVFLRDGAAEPWRTELLYP